LIKIKFSIAFIIVISFIFCSCKKDDTPVTTEDGNGVISGAAKYLDNTIAPFARIELQSVASGRSIYSTCDSLGKFSFGSLHEGAYTLIFRSTNYDINTTYTSVNLDKNQSINQNVYIRYNMLDDFATSKINDGVFFIKFQPDGAKLDGNFSLVDHLSGYYRNNSNENVTLSATIYKIPAGIDWNDMNFMPDSIPSDFDYLFEVNDDSKPNGSHEIQITGDGISSIFSNPPNGFAFVIKKDSVEAKLKIPCVDFNNNDFGLKIFYK
jgi:hypothetical protein